MSDFTSIKELCSYLLKRIQESRFTKKELETLHDLFKGLVEAVELILTKRRE